jgi:alpha-L-rhamnosidase
LTAEYQKLFRKFLWIKVRVAGKAVILINKITMKNILSAIVNKDLIALYIFLLLTTGCGKRQNQPAVNEKADLQQAGWITDATDLPAADSLLYGDFPAPLFRKEFSIKKEIKAATLYITAAGYYSASINGRSIDKNYIDPAWTDFSKRIYYEEYDVTSDVKQKVNCLGITLGNGFYNPLPMKMWGRYNLRNSLTVGKPTAIARLKIEYKNGETEEVITDKSWKHSYGPIIKNNVYLGEVYNAGKELTGWNIAGYNDSDWKKSVISNGPGGRLEKAFFPAVQVTGLQKPIAVSSPETDTFIVDMGVNFTGLYRIRLKGQSGDTITFRFGERLYENGSLNPMTAVCGQIKRKGIGGPGSPDIAWQTDSYIFGNTSDVSYSPIFTFHVYRYMEITGLKYKPDLADIEGIIFNTNVSDRNSFSSSSELINSIQTATKRTFLNNLISVQSDCPGREKFGYGGDLNATSESFIDNFDMQAFYRKTIYDWVDLLNDTVFVDTAPYVKLNYCGISWESAFITTQYQLYLYYNDTAIIKELYDLDLKWMEKAARLHPSGIVDKGLSDHESLVKVPVMLIGTTHYFECARIMKIFAGLMNDKENSEKFRMLAEKLKESVLNMYWRKSVPDTLNRQTLFSTLLYYNIIPEGEKKAATDSLLKAVKLGPSGHFTTGIFGTKYILEALSSTGNTSSVFNIVNSTGYPGWGFMIDRGATTIWETWKESDNVYSNCHPMFGSVSEWFYRWLGGIRPNPDHPGFEKFTIAPTLPEGLDFVKCSYNSPYGEIVSNWSRKGNNHQVFEIKIPEGSLANVNLPVTGQQKLNVTKKMGDGSYLTVNGEYKDIFELKPGEYIISVTPAKQKLN